MKFDADFSMTIGGRSVAGTRRMSVTNPATADTFAEAPDCTEQELDLAVAAARSAFPAWSAAPVEVRQNAVREIGRVLGENVEKLMPLFTREQGKPLEDARLEMLYGAMWCEMAANLAPPVTVIEDSAERHVEVRHVPLGVAGAIIPWNFPVLLAIMKICPALIAGCTMILKPSPFTPLVMLKLGELLQGVLPDGVLNIVTGGDEVGPWMTGHPGIDKISFTGSTATGRKVMAAAATSLKRVTLELGGNDPAIVLPDVDIDTVVPEIFWGAFRNSAQFCLASKRLYVHEAIYDRFANAFVDFAKSIMIGDGAEPGSQLGPIQNRPQYERVVSLIEDARQSGLKFLTGEEPIAGDGFFVPVTLLDNPPEDSRVVQEEAFGPVLPLLKFRSTDEVIAKANASEYGLGASVWSGDADAARALGERLHCGMVWINEIHYNTPFTPLGGHKQSGIGVENSVAGILEYTNHQTIVTRKGAHAGA